MDPLEAIATLLGVANVVLIVRRSIWNYPAGLAMVALYAWIFYGARLYSDAGLQLFFFAIQIYGWWAWARAGTADRAVAVERLTAEARAGWIGGIAIACVGWGALMARATDAAYPWWDGSVAVISIAAQIQLAQRLIENWLLWIVVDVVAIGLYLTKGLYLTAGLYAVFLVLCGVGLVQWLRAARAQAAAA